MLKYIKFVKYLLVHKFWVFVYCCKYGLYWQGLIHDLDKFKPSIMIPYANFTFGPGRTINSGLKNGMPDKKVIGRNSDFAIAVTLHKLYNKHHWEYWVFDGHLRRIPEKFILEMFCDWKSASKIHRDFKNCYEWYNKNKRKIKLHLETRKRIEELLKEEYNVKNRM